MHSRLWGDLPPSRSSLLNFDHTTSTAATEQSFLWSIHNHLNLNSFTQSIFSRLESMKCQAVTRRRMRRMGSKLQSVEGRRLEVATSPHLPVPSSLLPSPLSSSRRRLRRSGGLVLLGIVLGGTIGLLSLSPSTTPPGLEVLAVERPSPARVSAAEVLPSAPLTTIISAAAATSIRELAEPFQHHAASFRVSAPQPNIASPRNNARASGYQIKPQPGSTSDYKSPDGKSWQGGFSINNPAKNAELGGRYLSKVERQFGTTMRNDLTVIPRSERPLLDGMLHQTGRKVSTTP